MQSPSFSAQGLVSRRGRSGRRVPCRGAIRISSPAGKHLGTLHLALSSKEPRQQVCATNVAFGDADARSLYITACTAMYRIRVKIPGVIPGPQQKGASP
jgi:hypothetical protein